MRGSRFSETGTSPDAPLRTGLHTLIRTNLQKQLLEERARKAAQHFKEAKSGAQHVARFATRVERTVMVAPLSFSHEISAAMRQGTGARFILHLCRRFVLFYLPWVGMVTMACIVGAVNVFASAQTGDPSFFHSAYAATIEESGMSQTETPANIFDENVYVGAGAYVVSNTPNADRSTPAAVPTAGNDSLQDSVLYGAPTPVVSSAPPAEIPAGASSRTIITYTVKEGDVPSIIASSFGISLDTLLWANNLKDGDYIRPGDRLTILPVSGVVYKVQKGDTLAGVARRFKGDASQIIVFNSLASADAITEGQSIIIPNGQMPTVERKSQSLYTPAYASASELKDISGYFIAPAHGHISQGLHAHNAVDIANSCGTPIYAAAAGKVLIADASGWNGGYGKYILIQHPNGVETRYAHSEHLIASSGETVAQGQLIMYMGETGHATGCHVHFEILGAYNKFAHMRQGTDL